jgi:hypothetical protein
VNIELECRGTFTVRTSATAKAIGDPSFFKNPALLGLVAQQPTSREHYWSLRGSDYQQ